MFRRLFITNVRIFAYRLKNYRKYCSGTNGTYNEELTVQTFCDVKIKVPFNVVIKPLDVHQYHNCDKLIVKLNKRANLHTSQDGAVIDIFSDDTHCAKDTVCSIKAPSKANLHVESTLGDITIGSFHGDSVQLKTIQGNIIAKRYEGRLFESITRNGNINFIGAVQAANISAKIEKKGSITTDRLQGGQLLLATKNGNIAVKSSYCKESDFEIDTGELLLGNLHQNCRIAIKKNGKLYLTGLDGKIEANLQNTEADIQISRFSDDSQIVLNDGNLILRLSEDSQHNTFNITGNIVQYYDVKLNKVGKHHVQVEGGKANVEIRQASWLDMVKQKVNKQ